MAASLAPGLSLAPAQASEDEPVTFTVAYLNEVDSFNPFLGIEASSFEMWSLMYDSLTGYAMEDMQPTPALATEWDTSDDGLTWTYTLRDDVDLVRRRAADGPGRRSTPTSGSATAGPSGRRGASTSRVSSRSARRTTPPSSSSSRKPSALLPLLPIPIVPEHVWKDVSDDEMRSYGNEPSGGEPVVGSGPFRLVEGTAGGSTYRFEVNPDYWDGAPHLDELVFRVYKSEDPAIQALVTGEVDFVEGINALQVQALEGRDGISAQMGDSPGFDEIAFNTGSVDVKSGQPLGDPNPAVLDPAFRWALNFGIDRDQIIETAYQGAGLAGDTIIPPAYARLPLGAAADEDACRSTRSARRSCWTKPGTPSATTGFRTLPSGEPIGTLRLYARSDSQTSVDVMELFSEWLADLDIDSEVQVLREQQAHRHHLDEGTFDAFEWGWYVEPDPSSMLSYMTLRRARQLVGLLVLQGGLRRPLRAAAGRAGRRGAPGPGQADAGDALRRRALPGDRLQHRGRGLAQRPVRLPAAAARPGRGLPDPVRRLQLRRHATGVRGRRVRRRGGVDAAQRRAGE